MSKFRVTVEDLENGEKKAIEVFAGDYLLIPFEPCYLHHTDAHLDAGTHVLTVKGHRPTGSPQRVEPCGCTPTQECDRHYLDADRAFERGQDR